MSKLTKLLREAANWLEAHPEVEPFFHTVNKWGMEFQPEGREGMAITARIFGKANKEIGDNDDPSAMYTLATELPSGLRLRAYDYKKNVCKRVQVGTRHVEERVEHIPAHEAPVYKWECPPLLEGDEP